MTNLKSTLALASAISLSLGASALAGEAITQNNSKDIASSETPISQQAQSEVLGTIAVKDDEGRVFYNHYVPKDDLFTVDYDIEVFDTVTFEHDGRTYTNKIVKAK